MRGGQRIERPLRRALGHGVEALRFVQAARDLVVIAPHGGRRRQPLHAIDDGVGIATVTDEIAQDEDTIGQPRGAASARQVSSASRLAWMSVRTR